MALHALTQMKGDFRAQNEKNAELAHLVLLLTVLFVSPALGPPFPHLQALSTDPESGAAISGLHFSLFSADTAGCPECSFLMSPDLTFESLCGVVLRVTI